MLEPNGNKNCVLERGSFLRFLNNILLQYVYNKFTDNETLSTA